jgi:hypothetical protein
MGPVFQQSSCRGGFPAVLDGGSELYHATWQLRRSDRETLWCARHTDDFRNPMTGMFFERPGKACRST